MRPLLDQLENLEVVTADPMVERYSVRVRSA
jgi:hypothetical protein